MKLLNIDIPPPHPTVFIIFSELNSLAVTYAKRKDTAKLLNIDKSTCKSDIWFDSSPLREKTDPMRGIKEIPIELVKSMFMVATPTTIAIIYTGIIYPEASLTFLAKLPIRIIIEAATALIESMVNKSPSIENAENAGM